MCHALYPQKNDDDLLNLVGFRSCPNRLSSYDVVVVIVLAPVSVLIDGIQGTRNQPKTCRRHIRAMRRNSKGLGTTKSADKDRQPKHSKTFFDFVGDAFFVDVFFHQTRLFVSMVVSVTSADTYPGYPSKLKMSQNCADKRQQQQQQ